MEKSQTGLAGEFYTLAQLTHRGLIATLTLGNTKGVDILVTNQEINSLFKVEVKTTVNKPRKEKLFGHEEFFMWTMGKKHEEIRDSNLVYCFVCLQGANTLPRFFIVPSDDVADYVKWQHDHWLSTRVNLVKETAMRTFRISLSDPNGYENNWRLLGICQND
ncbi:hypothetical protein LMJ53_16745 [Rheinheimera sp. UJ51]|uniref:hypothetical protein n=1 Tax=Rheinheimera sp. UJ51 TaxID=2892446 RepID=UPI001E52EF8C|nr:hypothetical protein [Rheinheimera sp. UJ51]MCC5453365.1 hypothetical protein [Rheinheimera sp. UJ51]